MTTTVYSNPLNHSDPYGLATYICKRPLGGEPRSSVLPIANHQYACVGDDINSLVCSSTTAGSGGALDNVWLFGEGSQGVPTTPDDGDYYHPDACEQELDDNDCVETCIQKT